MYTKVKMIAGKFKIEQEIGRGAYATVYSAKLIQPYPPLNVGDFVAIKSISTSRISSPQEKEKLENEISLMQNLDHKNIVKLYGVEKVRSYYFLVMEHCQGGDLIHYLHSYGSGLPELTIRDFISQIGSGLKYLHAHQIVHRDLKPHNILMSGTAENPVLKIADFGFARFLRPTDLAETICGSPIYMAPEIQFGSTYSSNVDMWSLGVILYELITTKPPFPHVKTQYELAQELKERGSQPYSLPASAHVSSELRDLVVRLLTIDHEKRLTLPEFLNHQFFAKYQKHETMAAVSNDESSESFIRERKFSFVMAEGAVDDIGAEKMVRDALDSANIIALHLSNAQLVGDSFLVFELLTIMSEFLLDFLAEYERVVSHMNVELKSEVMEVINGYMREAGEYTKREMNPGSVRGSQFLYNKALEYAKVGGEAERNKDSFSLFKYHRALAMLRPIAYSIDSDEFTTSVRELFIQISKRCDLLHQQGNEE